jgi:formyl-CoA transferase
VYCSITGFGSAAGAHLPGYDFVVQALGGLMSVTGTDSSGPLKVGVAVVDVITGKDAVIGILAALADRERTGLGQRVEVNLLSSLLGALVNQASAALATGVSPPRLGNQHPSIAPYETLRCADGVLAIAVGNDAQFARLAAVLGRPELADDPRLRTNADRVAHRDVMRVGLEVALATRTAHEWQQALTDAGVPVGVVSDVLGAFELAASLGLEPAIDVGDGHAPQIRNPVSYGRSLLRPPSPPPALGQHDDEVRAWLAGPPDQKGT